MKKQGTSTGWAYMLLSMMLIGFALTLIGCKSKENMTEKVRVETLIKEVHDTLWLERLVYVVDSTAQSTTKEARDCTVIRQDAHGNIIGTDRWHFRDTNKELSHSKEKVDSTAYFRSIIDSLRRIKNDNVYIEKVKEASLWDNIKSEIKQRICGLLHIVIAAVIIYLIWYVKRKDKQNI